MAKYLDENGLKTLISNIKQDIKSTAWKDAEGNISSEFLERLQKIIGDLFNKHGITENTNVEDMSKNLAKSLSIIFNLGRKNVTYPTEFSTGQYITDTIFEHTGYATWNFNGVDTKASCVGSLLLLTSDANFWVPEDTTKIYTAPGDERVLVFNLDDYNSTGGATVICDVGGDLSKTNVSGEFDSNTLTFVSSDLTPSEDIKLSKIITIPAGLYMVVETGRVLNILSGVQYKVGVNSITTDQLMKPVESLGFLQELKTKVDELQEKVEPIDAELELINSSIETIESTQANQGANINTNTSNINSLNTRVTTAEGNVSTNSSKVDWLLKILCNVNSNERVNQVTAKQIIVPANSEVDLFTYTLDNSFHNSDLGLHTSVASTGNIICVLSSNDYFAPAVENIYKGDNVIPVYAMRVTKNSDESYTVKYLDSTSYRWETLVTRNIIEQNGKFEVVVESSIIGQGGMVASFMLDNANKVTIPAGLYMSMGYNRIVNIVSGVHYKLTESGVEKSQVYAPFIPSEYNTDSIINNIETLYEYFSFKSAEAGIKHGDLMLEFNGSGDGTNLTLFEFGDNYDSQDFYNWSGIVFDEDHNNILKANIKGSNIFGEIKLIPINTANSPADNSTNATYIASHKSNGSFIGEIGRDYCLVFTGRGTLSSIAEGAVGDEHHTVKISTGDTVKTSSIYPVHLFKNNEFGFNLLTLPADDPNLIKN